MEVIDERRQGTLAKIKSSQIFKRLKSIKNIELIAAVFIIAIALVIYSSVVSAKTSNNGEEVQTVSTESSMDEDEEKLAAILGGIKGAGEVEVMISRDSEDIIVGVLVVAEGADDIGVMLKLLNATTTALGVDKKIVEVYKKG